MARIFNAPQLYFDTLCQCMRLKGTRDALFSAGHRPFMQTALLQKRISLITRVQNKSCKDLEHWLVYIYSLRTMLQRRHYITWPCSVSWRNSKTVLNPWRQSESITRYHTRPRTSQHCARLHTGYLVDRSLHVRACLSSKCILSSYDMITQRSGTSDPGIKHPCSESTFSQWAQNSHKAPPHLLSVLLRHLNTQRWGTRQASLPVQDRGNGTVPN